MRNTKKKVFWRVFQVIISSLVGLGIIAAFIWATQGRDIPVLDPKGLIADQEQILILITVGLGVFVVVPVFVLLFVIAFRYRSTNTKAKYDPELAGSTALEVFWWGIPLIIILVLAIITAISTHALDPYKKLDSSTEPVKVQVVALQWKWLFIYPESHVATLNYLNIPENTPVELSITADAPMNSFWVPALAGQVYAMTGMSTKLSFIADGQGTFRGASSNISGEGSSDMTFAVHSKSQTDFSNWLYASYRGGTPLSWANYPELAKASRGDGEKTYSVIGHDLYDQIIMKYMSSEDMTHEDMQDTHTDHVHTMENSTMPGMGM